MSDELKPSSWPGRFLSWCLKIFVGVALLALAIDVAGRIWPILLGMMAAATLLCALGSFSTTRRINQI